MKPGPQLSHAVAPVLAWKLRSGHSLHSWLRSLAENVPLAHGVCADAPAKQKDPAGHAVHASLLPRPAVAARRVRDRAR